MTREVAFRASALLVLATLVLAAFGGLSHSAVSEAFVTIAGLLCLKLAFAATASGHAPVPVRARQGRSRLQ